LGSKAKDESLNRLVFIIIRLAFEAQSRHLATPFWDYPDSVDSRQGSTGVSVRVLMDTCS
jgi:hypothetical protein